MRHYSMQYRHIAARLLRAFFMGLFIPTCSPRAFCKRAKKEVMTHEFTIDGERFITTTVQGSALIQIYHQAKKQLIASFDANTPSLFSHRAYGSWSNIHPEASLSLLEKIQPHLIEHCKQRIMARC